MRITATIVFGLCLHLLNGCTSSNGSVPGLVGIHKSGENKGTHDGADDSTIDEPIDEPVEVAGAFLCDFSDEEIETTDGDVVLGCGVGTVESDGFVKSRKDVSISRTEITYEDGTTEAPTAIPGSDNDMWHVYYEVKSRNIANIESDITVAGNEYTEKTVPGDAVRLGEFVPTSGGITLFVTVSRYTGGQLTRSEADAECSANHPNGETKSRTVRRVWNEKKSVADMDLPEGPYVDIEGNLIASNYDDLIAGRWTTKHLLDGNTSFWSGFLTSGMAAGNCDEWRASDPFLQGTYSVPSSTGLSTFGGFCSDAHGLLCFEVP